MKKELSQLQRLFVAAVYISIMVVLFALLGGNIRTIMDSNNNINIWFFSGALFIVLGSYVTEPFFTKPTDTIANTIALILALLAIKNKSELFAYYIIFIFALSMLLLSIITIALKDKENKIGNLAYWIVKNLGTSKVIFSTIYLASAYSYFSDVKTIGIFVVSIALWICLTFFDVVGIIILRLRSFLKLVSVKQQVQSFGKAIECYSASIYTIETHPEKTLSITVGDIVGIRLTNNMYYLAIVTNKKILLDKNFIEATLICNSENVPIKVKSNEIGISDIGKSIFDRSLEAILLYKEDLPDSTKLILENNRLYKSKEYYVGCVMPGSNVNIINFSINKIFRSQDPKIKEGTILLTSVYGEPTLYQVINGITKEESIDTNNNNGYICGIARKLGVYDISNCQLEITKWLPNTSEAVYLLPTENISDSNLNDIAQTSIGRLPETNMKIPIADINSLVTHNTAILGILGVGKSCLAYELIKKITDNNVKVICIDITDQYYSDKGLFNYIQHDKIENDLSEEYVTDLLKNSKTTGTDNNPAAWGNQEKYRNCIKLVLTKFFESEKNVFVINPEKHAITKAATLFRVAELVDLTVVEKTRIITEELLSYTMGQGQTSEARCLIVYEEAHSLIPEWNSVSSDGDKTAANGIAKVILQGRKYGLGCLVITQRTANVTKSILNQCNTIFALRIFDDTGKTFLENYIGKDYSDTLPTLEERHVIAFGKGLMLKQPVIVQLNDKKYFEINNDI